METTDEKRIDFLSTPENIIFVFSSNNTSEFKESMKEMLLGHYALFNKEYVMFLKYWIECLKSSNPPEKNAF